MLEVCWPCLRNPFQGLELRILRFARSLQQSLKLSIVFLLQAFGSPEMFCKAQIYLSCATCWISPDFRTSKPKNNYPARLHEAIAFSIVSSLFFCAFV